MSELPITEQGPFEDFVLRHYPAAFEEWESEYVDDFDLDDWIYHHHSHILTAWKQYAKRRL